MEGRNIQAHSDHQLLMTRYSTHYGLWLTALASYVHNCLLSVGMYCVIVFTKIIYVPEKIVLFLQLLVQVKKMLQSLMVSSILNTQLTKLTQNTVSYCLHRMRLVHSLNSLDNSTRLLRMSAILWPSLSAAAAILFWCLISVITSENWLVTRSRVFVNLWWPATVPVSTRWMKYETHQCHWRTPPSQLISLMLQYLVRVYTSTSAIALWMFPPMLVRQNLIPSLLMWVL